MDMPQLRIPSFSGWLSRKGIFFQIQFHTFLQFAAFIIWIFSAQYLQQAYPILGPQLSSVVGTVPALIYFEVYRMWDSRNKNEAISEYAFNPKLQWSLEEASDEIMTTRQPVTIKQDDAAGLWYYHIPIIGKLRDPLSKEDYFNILLISRRPFKEVFKEAAGGIRAFKGSIFPGPTIQGWWVYAASFNSGNAFPELSEDVETPYRVFYDAFGLFDGDEVQKRQGLSPSSGIENETIVDAIKKIDSHLSIQTMLKLRDSEAENRWMIDQYQDSSQRATAKGHAEEEINKAMREPPPMWKNLDVKWLVIGAVLLYGLYVAQQWIQKGGAA